MNNNLTFATGAMTVITALAVSSAFAPEPPPPPPCLSKELVDRLSSQDEVIKESIKALAASNALVLEAERDKLLEKQKGLDELMLRGKEDIAAEKKRLAGQCKG